MHGNGLGGWLKTCSVLNLAGRNGAAPANQPAYMRLIRDLAPYIIAVCSSMPIEPMEPISLEPASLSLDKFDQSY
jgi:hypothetical protein